MRIKENKNLKYNKVPKVADFSGDYDALDLDPKICVLESFNRTNDKIDLCFKNKSRAVIMAKNIEGGRDMDLIEKNLGNFIGRSYEEILNTDFL